MGWAAWARLWCLTFWNLPRLARNVAAVVCRLKALEREVALLRRYAHTHDGDPEGDGTSTPS